MAPVLAGSSAIAVAIAGVFTVPEAGESNAADSTLGRVDRPADESTEAASGVLGDAAHSFAHSSFEALEDASVAIMEQQRREAAEREARRTREARRWVLPLSSYRITAGFGERGGLWVDGHTGVDLAASSGDPVGAVSSGEIVFAGYDGPYGYKIVVRHWDGSEAWYCHLSEIVQRSGSVSPGDVIGRVGATGNVTGPHLHLEVRPSRGAPVDPRPWLAERGAAL